MNSMTLDRIPKESVIRAKVTDNKGNKIGDYVVFHHCDGMYSYCTVQGTEVAVHFSRFQELELADDGIYHLK